MVNFLNSKFQKISKIIYIKMFSTDLNLDKIAHLCKVQPAKPPTKEQLDKILGRISQNEL
jgi:hypothetical protein